MSVLVPHPHPTDVMVQAIVQGDHLYGVNSGGPIVWFVRYPHETFKVSVRNPPLAGGNYLAMQGHYMYITEGFYSSSVMYVADVVDPSKPELKPAVTLNVNAHLQMSVQGKHIVVGGKDSNDKGAFQLLDISDPGNVVQLHNTVPAGIPFGPDSELQFPGVTAKWLFGKYLFTGRGMQDDKLPGHDDDPPTDDRGKIETWDITDPDAPVLVGSYTTQGSPRSFWADGVYFYAIISTSSTKPTGYLHIFLMAKPWDLQDFSILSIHSEQTEPQTGTLDYITGQGHHVYISGTVKELWQVDVFDRTSPFVLNHYWSSYGSWPSIQGRFLWWNPYTFFIGGFYCEEMETEGLQVDGTASMDILHSRIGNFAGEIVAKSVLVARGGGLTVDGIEILAYLKSLEQRVDRLKALKEKNLGSNN